MSDPVTANKQFFIPLNGSDIGTWDIPANANFTSLDAILGGTQSIGVSGTYALTETQANNLLFKLTGSGGTLTFPAIGGIWVVQNNTSGNVTVASAGAGSTIVMATNTQTILASDGANIYQPVVPGGGGGGGGGNIPSGSVLLFLQSSAPTGFTQVVSYNDMALRLVSGSSGGSVTGVVGFSGWLAGGTGYHTLVTAEMPSHTHGITDPGHAHSYDRFTGATPPATLQAGTNQINDVSTTSGTSTTGITISGTGGDAPHNHPLNPLAYVDAIVCSKN